MRHSKSLSCPPRPSNTEKSLLVVFLTDWFDGDVQKTVDNLRQSPLLNGIQIVPWKPSATDLQSASQLHEVESEIADSQNTLYSLAIGASGAGWPNLIVADGLTRRQTNGDHRNGESSVPSFISVSVDASSSDDGLVRVVARRTESDQEDAVSLDELQNLELTVPARMRPCDLTAEHGLMLHNPDAFVFSEKTIDTGHAQDENVRSILDFLPPPDSDLNIFVLGKSTPEELEKLRSRLQQAADEFREAIDKDDSDEKKITNLEKWKAGDENKEPLSSINLVECDPGRSPTRRDILRLWKAYAHPIQKGVNDIMHFLVQEIETEKPFIAVYRNRDGPLIIARNSLQTVLNDALNRPYLPARYNCCADSRRYQSIANTIMEQKIQEVAGEFELLVPYDKPFYPTSKPWKPITRYMNAISLFYSTSSFSREQHEALEGEIGTPGKFEDNSDIPKVCCFEPWTKGPEDGMIEDTIWDIYFSTLPYRDSPDWVEFPFFIIDRQSASDGTIIACMPDYYWGLGGVRPDEQEEKEKAQELLKDVVEPQIRGFHYGRVDGREAHNYFQNLSIANLSWDELFEKSRVTLRPGWPGHGILKNEWEGL
ncbi:hypothetical protein BDV19DRAFT_256279 [Aspergillus venezuelensis]